MRDASFLIHFRRKANPLSGLPGLPFGFQSGSWCPPLALARALSARATAMTAVAVILTANAARAMGKPYLPCPSKDGLACMRSARIEIDEVDEHGETPSCEVRAKKGPWFKACDGL